MANKSSDSVAVPGKQSRNERIEEFLREHYAFRYNTVKSRAEFRSGDGEFLPVTKYRLNSFRRELDRTIGISTSAENLRSMLESDFSERVNPVQAYFHKLPDRYNALLAQLAGRLEVIDKENRTIITEILNFKKSLSEFKNEVDTTKFEKLSNHTLWEMKTQIRYLKQPPIVLRTIVFLTVLSILTILATGYLYRDRNEWRGEATYWYKQNDQYKTTQTNKK